MNKAGIVPSVLELFLISELILMKTIIQTRDICFPMEISSVEGTGMTKKRLADGSVFAGATRKSSWGRRRGLTAEERGRVNWIRGMGSVYMSTGSPCRGPVKNIYLCLSRQGGTAQLKLMETR